MMLRASNKCYIAWSYFYDMTVSMNTIIHIISYNYMHKLMSYKLILECAISFIFYNARYIHSYIIKFKINSLFSYLFCSSFLLLHQVKRGFSVHQIWYVNICMF